MRPTVKKFHQFNPPVKFAQRDSGQSTPWQLIGYVFIGVVVLIIILAILKKT